MRRNTICMWKLFQCILRSLPIVRRVRCARSFLKILPKRRIRRLRIRSGGGWRDFAAAIGVSEETLWTSTPLPAFRLLIETYRQICNERRLAEAVAALYAYEAQALEIAASKIDGLCRHYGVNAAQGLAYFIVHAETGKVQRAAWRAWLESCGNDLGQDSIAAEEQVLATAGKALDALWGALDSVQEARIET